MMMSNREDPEEKGNIVEESSNIVEESRLLGVKPIASMLKG